MNESLVKLKKYHDLEKVIEFTQYFVIILGILVIQLPLPMEINKTGVYIISLFFVLYSIFLHRLLPVKYAGMNKIFLESLVGILGIFILVNLTGGVRSYFNFFYFLPILSSSVYATKKYFFTLTIIVSILIFFTATISSSSEEVITMFGIAGLQIWGVWLVAFLGRMLSEEINMEQKKKENIKLGEMSEVEKLKDEFIFIISHELRSPITAIRGYLEMLIKDTPQTLNEKTLIILQKAFSTSNKLSNLVTLLLEVARLETGKIHFYTQAVLLVESFDRVKYNLEGDIEQKNLEYVVNIPDDLRVRVDVERLEEILNIIIGNAVVYTPEFGKIEISAREIKDSVEIVVGDTGIGISEERKVRIFEKFYTEKTGVGGSTIKAINIGMYVVRQLIVKMGGRISIKSKIGEGTVFTFTLPKVKYVPVKAVIFDAGGVLFNSAESLFSEPIKYITKISGKSEDIVAQTYQETIKEIESKKIDKEGFWLLLTERLGISLPYSGQDPINFGFKKFESNKAVLNFAQKLKIKYKIAIISNANAIEASTNQAQSIYKYFDAVILSFKVGIRKPHPKIYKVALSKLKLQAEETVFIDNSRINLEEAKNLGMKAVLYKNIKQLKKDLVKIGVNINV